MKLKSIIVVCDGGLANRIRPIFSALALAELLKLPENSVKIFWKPTSVCEATLADVLDSGLHQLGLIEFSDLGEVGYFAREGCVRNAIRLFSRTEIIELESRYQRLSIDGLPNLRNVLTDSTTRFETLIIFDNQPLDLGQDFTRLYISKLARLKFAVNIEEEANAFLQSNKLNRFSPAVHARSTDFNLKYGFYAQKMSQFKDQRFFFTSDSLSFEKFAKRDFEQVILRNKHYPVHKSGFLGFRSDITRRRIDVIDAAVDLKILSSLNLSIYHPGSTYALLAKELASAYRGV